MTSSTRPRPRRHPKDAKTGHLYRPDWKYTSIKHLELDNKRPEILRLYTLSSLNIWTFEIWDYTAQPSRLLYIRQNNSQRQELELPCQQQVYVCISPFSPMIDTRTGSAEMLNNYHYIMQIFQLIWSVPRARIPRIRLFRCNCINQIYIVMPTIFI